MDTWSLLNILRILQISGRVGTIAIRLNFFSIYIHTYIQLSIIYYIAINCIAASARRAQANRHLPPLPAAEILHIFFGSTFLQTRALSVISAGVAFFLHEWFASKIDVEHTYIYIYVSVSTKFRPPCLVHGSEHTAESTYTSINYCLLLCLCRERVEGWFVATYRWGPATYCWNASW